MAGDPNTKRKVGALRKVGDHWVRDRREYWKDYYDDNYSKIRERHNAYMRDCRNGRRVSQPRSRVANSAT